MSHCFVGCFCNFEGYSFSLSDVVRDVVFGHLLCWASPLYWLSKKFVINFNNLPNGLCSLVLEPCTHCSRWDSICFFSGIGLNPCSSGKMIFYTSHLNGQLTKVWDTKLFQHAENKWVKHSQPWITVSSLAARRPCKRASKWHVWWRIIRPLYEWLYKLFYQP